MKCLIWLWMTLQSRRVSRTRVLLLCVERYQLPCTVTQSLRVISYGRSEHVQLIIHTLFPFVLVLLS